MVYHILSVCVWWGGSSSAFISFFLFDFDQVDINCLVELHSKAIGRLGHARPAFSGGLAVPINLMNGSG